MSRDSNVAVATQLRRQVPIFAALGDETRLGLIARLSAGKPCSISQLAEGTALTRQAITKHLRVLEGAGLVCGAMSGRECLFQLEPKPLQATRDYLDLVSRQWDDTLVRLKSFVENE